MTRRTFAGGLLAAAFGVGVLAQAPARPNFAGEWTIDLSRSHTTGGPARVSTPQPTGPPTPAPQGAVTRPRITEPTKTRNVPPVYPPAALESRLTGVVILAATIDHRGKVVDLEVVRSVRGLDGAAIKAVSQWEYTPALLNGVPVPIVMDVVVTFNIGGPGRSSSIAPGRGRGGTPPSVTIRQDQKSVTITRQLTSGPETMTYRFDGKASKNRLSTGGAMDERYTYVSRWEGDTLVSQITYRGPQGPREATETISLDAGALVIKTSRPSVANGADPYVKTQVFVSKR